MTATMARIGPPDDWLNRLQQSMIDHRQQYGQDWPPFVSCDWCGDSGTDPRNGLPCVSCDRGRAREHDEYQQMTWRNMIPANLRDLTLQSHPNPDLASQVAAWLRGSPVQTGTNLVIQGAVGTGKTGAAIGALRELHYTQKPKAHPDDATVNYMVRYWNLVNLIDRFKDEMDQTIPPHEKARATLMTCDVLLLDDIGVERMTDYVKERLYAIVNERYVRGLPTIYTSNKVGKAFEDYFDARITDRVLERAVLIVGRPDWKNLRRAK